MTIKRALLLCLLISSVAPAALILDRSLPTDPTYINSLNQNIRSNQKWAPGGPIAPNGSTSYILGDDFSFNSNAVIDSLKVWIVGENPNTTNPNQELNSISLYTGTDAGLTLASSNYTFQKVTYVNGQNFFNSNRNIYQPIFELTFSGLNWAVNGNTLYDFALTSTSDATKTADGLVHLLNLHASAFTFPNYSGHPGGSADGLFLAFNDTPYQLYFVDSSSPNCDYTIFVCSGNNIETDINVALYGTGGGGANTLGERQPDVPEPSSLALLGLGCGAILLRRRARR